MLRVSEEGFYLNYFLEPLSPFRLTEPKPSLSFSSAPAQSDMIRGLCGLHRNSYIDSALPATAVPAFFIPHLHSMFSTHTHTYVLPAVSIPILLLSHSRLPHHDCKKFAPMRVGSDRPGRALFLVNSIFR